MTAMERPKLYFGRASVSILICCHGKKLKEDEKIHFKMCKVLLSFQKCRPVKEIINYIFESCE